MKRLLALFLLLAAPLAAQSPVQTASVWNPSGNNSSYTCTFKSPVAPTDELVLVTAGPVSAVTDTQKNTWTQGAQIPQLGVWTANAVGGVDTIVITLSTP